MMLLRRFFMQHPTFFLSKSKYFSTSAVAANDVLNQAAIKNRQVFDYFVVIDFEATCEPNTVIDPQEIIEFPALKVNSKTFEIESTFHHFVRPVHNPVLSHFCTNLTKIVQETVDQAETFNVVFRRFEQWLADEHLLAPHTQFACVTAGDWDFKEMLPKQLRHLNMLHHLHKRYFTNWINCKRSFAEATGHYPRKITLMLESLGEGAYIGQQHSGVDDCKNIVRVLRGIANTGYEFRYTSWHASAQSKSAEMLKTERLVKQGWNPSRIGEADDAARAPDRFDNRGFSSSFRQPTTQSVKPFMTDMNRKPEDFMADKYEKFKRHQSQRRSTFNQVDPEQSQSFIRSYANANDRRGGPTSRAAYYDDNRFPTRNDHALPSPSRQSRRRRPNSYNDS